MSASADDPFTPAGGVEDDESPQDAARRELAEEMGLDRPDVGA